MLQAVTSGAQPVTKVAAGGEHSLFLKSDGSLWAMGGNDEGQLGDGTYNNTNRSEQIVATNVTAIAGGYDHSLFLKSDGSLWAVGYNQYGQLGDGTFNSTNLPEQVVASNVTTIAAGGYFSLFLKSDGSLWAMGYNYDGELGDGTTDSGNYYTNLPEQIVASGVTAIAAGGFHSLLLKSDDSLWAMGDNEYGQLGDGTYNITNLPERIVASNVTAIAAGEYHSLLLKSDGSLWAMGTNEYGQLGDGTYNTTNQPEQIVATNVTAIAAGEYHSLLLKSDGSLWAMGDNGYGELGDGTYNQTNHPELIVAGSIETVPPTNIITSPTPGQLWSNAAFTVTGTATDNVAVSNVLYSLNNAAWTDTVTTNNWVNWTAVVNLIAGTNTIQAYAVDTSGNISATNSVSFVAVLSTVLTVHTNGKGIVSPNYNGVLLQIGNIYSMTATAGPGFAFTNWTGSLTTNNATLIFTMASNLTFTANFVDTIKPTLSITNLTSGQRLSNATFTVKGTASDNWMVSNVWCQIDGLGWNSATNINNWTNWAVGVTLVPGTNMVQAYAVDTSGNVSTTKSVSFQYVVTNLLAVRATGLGTISPNYSNAWLEIGRNYSMTATPASGFVVTNWTISTNWLGGRITNNATVQFMMASNLTLQVTFADVTKPTLSITAPTSGQKMTNALANVKGTASDNWGVTNVWYQLNGGTWSLATSTNGWTNWTVALTLVAGTNTVKAYAVDLGANLSATNSVSFVSSNTFQLQLGFAVPQPMASNGLNFNLQVSLGVNGRIEASTNLVNWLTLTNFVGTNPIIYFRDAAATNLNQRFYRAVTP